MPCFIAVQNNNNIPRYDIFFILFNNFIIIQRIIWDPILLIILVLGKFKRSYLLHVRNITSVC